MAARVKQNIVRGSNFHFNLDKKIATSYGWWRFVGEINGQLVFNSYPYSKTTIKHQSKARYWMEEHDMQPDLVIESHISLDHSLFYSLTKSHLSAELNSANDKHASIAGRPASRAYQARIERIQHLQLMLMSLESLYAD